MKISRTSSRKFVAPKQALRRRLTVERLEDRSVPATLSIGSASVIEGNNTLRSLDRFVEGGSGGLAGPNFLVFGPDGNQDGAPDLYVTGIYSNAIHRYDGRTGAFMDTFVAPGSGGLNQPRGIAFGPDGNLYVASFFGNQILRYDGSTGAFLGVVASGVPSPLGLTFGADGGLYIDSRSSAQVFRYRNGALTTFVTAGSGGLSEPAELQFGPDWNGDGVQELYVTSNATGQVLRYDGASGAFINVFTNPVPGQAGLGGLRFGADGFVYVNALTTPAGSSESMNRYNAATGAFVDTFTEGDLNWAFTLGPDGLIYQSNGSVYSVDRFGPRSVAVFTVSLSTASATPVTVNYTTASGTATAGSDFTALTGTLTFAPGQTTRVIPVVTIDDTLVESYETFTVNLSNPTGATIATGQGVGTIVDNEPPQVSSITVNDGSAQRSEVRSIAVTFSGPVTFTGGTNAANALQLVSLTDLSLVTRTATLSFDSLGRTVATLTFSGADTDPVSAQNGGVPSLADGRYSLTITAGLIVGYAGQALDGDANGTAGGNYVSPTDTLGGGAGQLHLYRMFGDANGDGVIDQVDLGMLRRSFNASAGSPFYLSFLDADNSGVVDQFDLAQFRSRFNLNVF